MTKASKLNWHIPVPKDLQEGFVCDHWTEDGDIELDCLVKVDECGFFIYWKSENKEGDVLELSQINDVRSGKVTVNSQLSHQLRQRRGENFGETCLTVCSGLDMVNINLNHFILPSKEALEVWRSGLRMLTNNVKMNNVCPMTNLEKHWKRLHMTTTVDGKVSVRAIAKTFASGKTEKFVYQTIAECGLPSGKNESIDPGKFTFEKFYKIYQTLCPRTDIYGLFQEIRKDTHQNEPDTINAETFVNFLNEKQRDPRLNEILYPHYDHKRVMEIINTYEKNPDFIAKGLISIDGLTNYLMSDENAPVFLDRLDIYQDMDNPLPHYYVNSSHNTYLTGRQFGGKSSVEMYRQVLLAGCRCVELDCWDGRDPDNEPIITHGKAMCTDILFKDVIYAIRDCAFVTSDYPLILSFENHCNRHQQYKMAKYCDDIFGDLLLKEPLPDYQLEPGVAFPSPNQLKRKILIKNKRLHPEVERKELELFWKGELAIDESEEETEDPKTSSSNPVNSTNGSLAKPDPSTFNLPPTSSTQVSKTAVVLSPSTSSSSAASTSSGLISTTPYQGSTLNVHPWLSSMVIYTQPLKFQGFDVAEEENMSSKMSSFAEPNALGYLKTQAIEFLNYNKRQLSRIYPKGARVDSSNFMPQIFWNSGCQLVSLNFQTPDLPMQLNQGKFEYNGNCGYLLKPDFMRRDDRQFDPFAETPVDGVIAAQCSVQVISGQFLSDRKVGTYVEVDMYGLPTDTIRREYKTKTVPNNGLNPVYNEEPFLFRKVVLPELAVLRFGVYDDNGKLLGQRILPFDCLQAGYRHIALRTVGNFPMTLPMLFCNIELKVYIPDGLGEFINALTDPRAFLSQQEARAKAMMGMGVDESDISTEGIIGKGKGGATNKKQGGGSLAITGSKKSDEKEDLKFEQITAEALVSEKRFLKVLKKQQKELEALKKRHLKEQGLVQKNQCGAYEKCVKLKGKESDQDAVNDPAVKGLLVEQAKHWTEFIEKQRKDEWSLTKTQLQEQEDVLRKLMEQSQQLQMKQLEIILEKEMKEIRASQARKSVENAKEVQMDKLKSKAEKDRRLREKHAKYTKIFINERKAAAMKQDQRREKLKKIHEQQHQDLVKYVQNLKVSAEETFLVQPKPESTPIAQVPVATSTFRFTFNKSTKSKK